MTTQIQPVFVPTIFKFQESVQLRVIAIDGEPWFVASDVAKALGYNEPHKAVTTHCKKAKSLIDIDGMNHPVQQNQGLDAKAKIIPESDFYRLVIRSKLETAEVFQDWVTDEVLPSIRKTGKYESPQHGLKSLPTEPLRKTTKALPGCLTAEAQDEIKQLIQDRAALLPKDKQASFVISMWSALGTHFGIKKKEGDKTPAYKHIPEGARLECLSLLARLSVDDLVTLTKDGFEAKIQERIQALPSPVKEGEVLPPIQPSGLTINLTPMAKGKDRRWLVSQMADASLSMFPIPDDVELVTTYQAVAKLKREGYIVIQKDEAGARLLVDEYLPYTMLPPVIEAAAQRLQRIAAGLQAQKAA